MFIVFLLEITAGFLYPSQIHLSWTENLNEMRVTWHSSASASGQIAYKPIRCSDDSDWAYSSAKSKRIDFGKLIKRYAYYHTGVMDNLNSSCSYKYQVGNGFLWSDVFTFKGKTPGIEDNLPYSLIIYGDLGTHEYSEGTMKMLTSHIESEDILGIIHMGDFAYDLHYQEGLIGELFFNMIQPLAANYPYMAIPGNHEKYQNMSHYKNRFNMPKNSANQGTSYFYSLNIGYVHYVLLNSYPYIIKDMEAERKTMTNWLINDLQNANNNRDLVPWIIIIHHHVLYCSHEYGNKVTRKDCEIQTAIMRHAFEDVYYNNKVDLVLQAHVHNYERMAAIYQNITIDSEFDGQNIYINTNAPVYILSGSAGNIKEKNDPPSKFPCLWSRFISPDYGFGKLTMLNRR